MKDETSYFLMFILTSKQRQYVTSAFSFILTAIPYGIPFGIMVCAEFLCEETTSYQTSET